MPASRDHDRNLTWDALVGLFPALPAPDRWLPRLVRHAELLAEAAPRVRVTAVTAEDTVRRHYAESLELLRVILAGGQPAAIADVGSGGGYPGLVFAAVLDTVPVHLIEPLQKRASLLVSLAAALRLTNVTVHPVRAEEAGRGPLRDALPVVTARAVASLPELLEYTAPLAAVGGRVVLPKGSGLSGEIRAATPALDALACVVESVEPMRPGISDTISVVTLRKRGPTPPAYPRRPGMAAKRPLALPAADA